MVTFNVDLKEFALLLAIIVRMGIVLFMLPIFNTRSVPSTVKALLVISFSVMLFPFIHQYVRPVPFEPAPLAGIIFGELIFGVFFSLAMLIVVSAFELAAQLIDFEMGLGFAQSVAPQERASVSVLSAFYQLLAILVLLSVNGHLIIIRILVHSFKVIPVGSFAISAGLFRRMVMLSAMLFVLALKLAAPAMAALILTQVGMGLMSKFAPQVNILATSFPVTIFIGMLFLSVTMVFWGQLASQSFAGLFSFLKNFSR
ncbi:MAG: flagellar biosynthetic protein FliR [Syntrophobacteraceae bacterium]|nr:flagellar biosynthetic protein FliR [Syntrophobacteraceae bacterium]